MYHERKISLINIFNPSGQKSRIWTLTLPTAKAGGSVKNDTVAWDVAGNRDETKCIDLDPINIFKTAPIVSDPLEGVS